MEEGSLLQQALSQTEDELHNTLVVSVFCITKSNKQTTPESILVLADKCVRLNQYLQQQQESYPWWSGGDGPVFGVHVEQERIPHLRAHCRYGPCVADEWKLIGLLLEYTASHQDVMLAVQCWDMDDGDVLLIQSAYELPTWVHEGGVDEATLCRNRCWIVNGQVTLIEPESSSPSAVGLTYAQALRMLAQNNRLLVSPGIQHAIRTAIQSHVTTQRHCAALAVPRSVAYLLSKRPDLVAAACGAFYQQATSSSRELPLKEPSTKSPAGVVWEDWVWTTHSFGRTQYALLRNLLAAPDWKTVDDMPLRYRSPQVQRLSRQASYEAMPHLRAGVQVGVRLVAGLDHLLSEPPGSQQSQPECGSVVERRVLQHWTRILNHSDNANDKVAWLLQAWQAGPNNSAHSLDQLVQCPVFEEEIKDSLTPLSHPDQSLASQIRSILKQGSVLVTEEYEGLPRATDVDNEEWMTMPSEDEMARLLDPVSGVSSRKAESSGPEKELDRMLGDVQTFLQGSSGVEGVTHDRVPASVESTSRPAINPTVFLNLLRITLQAEYAEEITFPEKSQEALSTVDPFFSAEDYDLLEPAEDGQVDSLCKLMQAMDNELQGQSSLSRAFDGPSLNVDSHVLSNFLESLEAGAGGPGPVRNILGELKGSQAP